MKKAIIIMAAAAVLTGCQPVEDTGTMNEPSGAERSADTNGSQTGAGQSGVETNSDGTGTSGNP